MTYYSSNTLCSFYAVISNVTRYMIDMDTKEVMCKGNITVCKPTFELEEILINRWINSIIDRDLDFPFIAPSLDDPIEWYIQQD